MADTDDPHAPRADRALVQKLRVVDKASLRFVDTGSGGREDTFDLGWEATPAPAERQRFEPKPRPPPPSRAPLLDPEANPFAADVDRLFPETPAPAPAPAAAAAAAPAPVPDLHAEPEPGPELPFPARSRAPTFDGVLETRPVVFEALGDDVLEAAMDSFDVIDVLRGETLIGEGERHPALVMPLRGALAAVRRGGHRVRVASGEVLGLTTLFGTGVWPFTLEALTDVRLLVLELDAYQELRSAGSRVSLAIEEHALDALLDGLEKAAGELAERLSARPLAEIVPSKGLLARVAAAFGAGGVSSARVDVVAALAASDLFRNAERRHLEALRDRWDGVRAGPGEFLVTQGQPGTHLYLLVSGAVDVISTVGQDRAVRHETLRPGDLFDGWSVLRDTGGRASMVVTEPSVLLELDKPTWAELAWGRDAVGSILRLAMLRSLTRRLVSARALLVELGGHARPVDDADSRFVTIHPADRR